MKLSKAQIKERDELSAALRENAEALDSAVDELNRKFREEVKQKLTPLVAAYNETRSRVETFVEGLGSEFRSDFDEKSERWQESDAGLSVDSFIAEFENFECGDAAKVPSLFDLEIDIDMDVSDRLTELPEWSDS